jgi:hypothetical protein
MDQVAAAFTKGGVDVIATQVALLEHRDKAVVERAARTLKKIAEADASALLSQRKAILEAALRASDVRVQWNLTIVLGRLPLRGRDKALAVDLIFDRLTDKSGLNRTMAMQALMDMSVADPGLRSRVLPFVQQALERGTPAMRARARKLLGIVLPPDAANRYVAKAVNPLNHPSYME